MIAARDVPPPDARELRACGFAAAAEAGVVFLPTYLALSESRGLDLDVGVVALPFVAAYVSAALLACRFRASHGLATAAVILGVFAGITLGRGDLNLSVFAVVIALLVALRVVTLGVRDWREPYHAELGWGAAALGVEAIVASGAEPDWRPWLVLFVPLFFMGGLASRASTVWTSGGAGDLDERVRISWIRRAVFATGALAGLMALAVVLGIRGGVLDRLGRLLTPAASAAASGLAWVLAQAARPIFWLVDRLGINPDRVREFLDQLRERGLGGASDQRGPGDVTLWQRALALVLFLSIACAIYWFIRRWRPRLSVEERSRRRVSVSTEPLREELPAPVRSRFRRELPADAVRRSYAEVLLALRVHNVHKKPALTPAEFVPDVVAAFPDGAEDFRALTRAYEDVRYGNLRLEPDDLRDLARRQRHLLAILDEPPPVAPPVISSG